MPSSTTTLLFLTTLLLLLASVTSAQTKDQCVSLDDPEAPLRKIQNHLSIIQFDYDALVSSGLVSSFMTTFPQVSQCLANYDGDHLAEILPSLMSSQCLPMLANIPNNQALAQLSAALPSMDDVLGTWAPFAESFLSAENAQYASVCDLATDDLAPCIEQVAVILMNALKTNSNGCCDAMFETSRQALGAEPDQVLNDVVGYGLDTLCAVRNPGFNENPEQTCVYTLVHVLLDRNPMEFLTNLLTLIQVPNQNACAAFSGQTFETTTSSQARLGTKDKSMDSCSQSMDALATRLANMPFLKAVPMDALFDDANCFELTEERLSFLDDLLGDSATILKTLLKNTCINLANGYSDSCTYASTLTSKVGPNVVQPKPDDGNPDPSGNDDDDDKTKGNDSSASLNVVSSLVLTLTWSIFLALV